MFMAQMPCIFTHRLLIGIGHTLPTNYRMASGNFSLTVTGYGIRPGDCAMADRKFYLPEVGEMKLQFFHVEDLCRLMEVDSTQMEQRGRNG